MILSLPRLVTLERKEKQVKKSGHNSQWFGESQLLRLSQNERCAYRNKGWGGRDG